MFVADVAALFAMQAELDRKIMESHNLGESEEIMKAKVLALYVELGELANETRCFKYWSLKPPSAKKRILEEYVDAMHFVLSLGLSLHFQHDLNLVGFQESQFDLQEIEKQEPNQAKHLLNKQVEAFETIFSAVATFSAEASLANYERLFQALLNLGHRLGFVWSEIEAAYLAKNEVNHRRQEEGY